MKRGAIVRLQVTRTQFQRGLKWLWVGLIPLSYLWREFLPWIVFISHYAIIAAHWGAEEAADDSPVGTPNREQHDQDSPSEPEQ